METTQLSTFFRSLSVWPKTDAELAAASEQVARLLEVPFAALVCGDASERIGFKLVIDGVEIGGDGEVVREFIRRQHRAAMDLATRSPGPAGQIRQVQIARETAPPAFVRGVGHLTLAAIQGDIRGDIGARDGKSRYDFGWVIVGSSKPLPTINQVAMLAVAQRLAELAELSFLENVIQLRSQFLSIASHELKTPLTSIYGMLQLQERMLRIKKDEPEHVQRERQESYLKMVIRQVKRLNELIDGLLDISRIQNGRFAVEPGDTDVSTLVREAVASRLHIIAHEAGVTIDVQAPDALHAWVDPVRMEEVVTNLAMNAIRFSPEGGVVWMRLKEDGESFRLSVRDQGPAVQNEDRERIFQPFERAQRTGRLGGLGLGLFISRQIAQLHGGNVSLVESIAGKGNLFEAHFPIRNSALAAS